MHKLLIVFLTVNLLLVGRSYAQNTISGKVVNSETSEEVPAVSITVKGSNEGTYTDDRGRFTLRTDKKLPLTLTVSSIGYESKEVTVSSFSTPVDVSLKPSSSLGQEVVVSASRTVQKKLSSPVTIEQISHQDIVNSPQLSYVDMVQNLKGVDVTVSSIGFTSITTRGFNTSGNTNFTQIVDGMDNQAPGLNFPLGSSISPTELDIDNIELLSGASSALYGSRGLNGTMVMSSKDPFKYQGLSVMITQGMNHVRSNSSNDPVKISPYYDWAVRWGKKVNEKFAFKFNFQLTSAKDWVASDTTDKNGGTKYTDPNYNAVNSYGSATSVDIRPFLEAAKMQEPMLAPIVDPLLEKPYYVARTGYSEYGYLDNAAVLFKSNAEFRYKIKPNLEAIASGTFGTGNIVYTNDTRYQIRGFKVGQYRLELRSDKWFLRTYTTQENSGRTLIAGPTAQYINEAWKVSYDGGVGGWYPEYTMGLLGAMVNGSDFNEANQIARSLADQGRPDAGSAYFNRLKDSISTKPIPEGGTLFLDRSKLYNTEFQYNFSDIIKFADVIAGVNWRLYSLNSKNTLFPDNDKPINVNEYSGYIQASKKLADQKLNLAVSFRLDKNTLFTDPRVTSRASAVYKVANENYIRFSYQNAYSFPSNIQALQSTLNGYNSFSSGGSNLLLNDHYHFNQFPPYTLESVEKYQQTNNPQDLKRFEYKDIQPQSVNAFELGYAALLGNRVLIDVLGYFSTWQNFIGYANVANTPGSSDPSSFLDHSNYVQYNIAFNGAQTVNTYGYAASVSVDMSHNFLFKVNYYSDYLKNKNNSQIDNFNTPHYHFNMQLENSGFGKKKEWSFNVAMRYKPGYYYVVSGGLAAGTVPSSTVFDAQISYKFINAHSGIRLGATNLTNKYYSTGMANPKIGGVYYVTYAYNIF